MAWPFSLCENGAPAATRTRDPRLRRVRACDRGSCLFSRLRGLPRGRATRLVTRDVCEYATCSPDELNPIDVDADVTSSADD